MAEEISRYYNVELIGGEWNGICRMIINYICKFNNSLQEVSAKYWPSKGDNSVNVGPFTIETTNETEWDKYFVRRIMKVKMITGIKVF